MTNNMVDKLDKLIASTVAVYESSKEFKGFDQDIVLCAAPEDLLKIHVYQGIETIAEIYEKEVIVDTGNTYHQPDYRHEVKIEVGDYTITFFQLKEVERDKTLFDRLLLVLLENGALKSELEMLKSSSK
jgi:hypothetical protein